MPIFLSRPCIANCGWLNAGMPPSCKDAFASPANISHDGSSSVVSRPGNTTAPCGKRATVAISSAVDGIEPVEPATITGALP
jgi:hypothetical protein